MDLVTLAAAKALSGNGGGSGGSVLVVTETNRTLDKTWQEIHDAFVAGSVRLLVDDDGNSIVYGIGSVGYDKRDGCFVFANGGRSYSATSASDYPTQSN